MLDDDGIGLLATGGLVGGCVEGTLYGEDCHASVVAVVYAYPAEADTFDALL